MRITRDRRTWVCVVHGCVFGYAGKAERCDRCGLSPEESVQARSATSEILKPERAAQVADLWKEGSCRLSTSTPNRFDPATGSELGMTR